MELSNNPTIALREIYAYLEALEVSDSSRDIVQDGKQVGHWLPWDYIDGLLQIKKAIAQHGFTTQPATPLPTVDEAIAIIVEHLRRRGYERMIVAVHGDHQKLCLNQHHARLNIEEIYGAIVRAFAALEDTPESPRVFNPNVFKEVAEAQNLTEPEVREIWRFALMMFQQGEMNAMLKRKKHTKTDQQTL